MACHGPCRLGAARCWGRWKVIPHRAISPCVSSWPCPVHTLPSVPVFESGVTVPTKLAPGLDSAPSPQADQPQLQKPQLSPRVGSSDQRNLRSPGLDRRPETWPSEEACDSICPRRAPSHTRTEGPEEQRTRGGGRGGPRQRQESLWKTPFSVDLVDGYPPGTGTEGPGDRPGGRGSTLGSFGTSWPCHVHNFPVPDPYPGSLTPRLCPHQQ